MRKRKSSVFRQKLETAIDDIREMGTPSTSKNWEPLDDIQQLRITNKDGDVVPFILKPPQMLIYNTMMSLRRQGKPQLIIVVKPRQIGYSTFVQAWNWVHIKHFPNRTAVTIAHEKSAAAELMQKSHRFHDYSGSQQTLSYKTTLKIQYAPPHNSAIHVRTANRPETLRSYTIMHAHLSEFAMYEKPEDFLQATMNSLVTSPEASCVIECTAKGEGGLFYEMVQASLRGENEWTLIFTPFQDEEEYQSPLEPGEQLILSPEERKYQKQYNLPDERMKWALWHKTNKLSNDWVRFHEEYPASLELAFRASGSPYFNLEVLRDAEVQEPLYRGELEWADDYEPEVEFIPNEFGRLSVWKLPEPGRRYVMSIDVGEGVRQDFSIIDVVSAPEDRTERPEQVAQWASNVTTASDVGVAAYQLGRWYNDALIGVERPGPGPAVLNVLKATAVPEHSFKQIGHLPYWNLYFEVQRDQFGEETKRAGWLNSSKTKTPALQELQAHITPTGLILHCRETVQELRGFQSDPASGGRHLYKQIHKNTISNLYNDDRVFSLVIAVQMLLHLQSNPGFRRIEASD
jgi:hypothetical protein